MDNDFERIVEFTPAYDKRDPDPKKNYGIGSVILRMVLKGPAGAVQFMLYTNWCLPHVQEELLVRASSRGASSIRALFFPLPADKGYHSPVPRYEGQEAISESCPYLDGRPCYYDGSSMAADELYNLLIAAHISLNDPIYNILIYNILMRQIT